MSQQSTHREALGTTRLIARRHLSQVIRDYFDELIHDWAPAKDRDPSFVGVFQEG